MPKNIVLFFDGTWNNAVSATAPFTNIHGLFRWAKPTDQIKNYYPGVGEHTGWLYKKLYAITGKGVFQAARHAWQWVAANFAEGDTLFLFGFSRGAFAARHLASMIVRCGLRDWEGDIELGFRKWLSMVGDPQPQIKQRVHYLGLFDCVPGNQIYAKIHPRSELNSPLLESGIGHFRHAVSRDERRWSFRPLLFLRNGQMSFEQRWFPGFHSDVGGGKSVSEGLASFSMWWMVREAYGLGLHLDNVECPRHLGGHALGVVRSIDTTAAPVSSDYWTTKLGLRWERAARDATTQVDGTPRFSDLIVCPRCGQPMFDSLKTGEGQSDRAVDLFFQLAERLGCGH